MEILHLSADYPDPLVPAKTRAVAGLLAAVRAQAPGIVHRVYSLNRIGWRAGIEALDFADAAGEGHRALAYGAPGKGLFLQRYLHRLADWIAADLDARGLRPGLVHAHKLSVEGLAGARLAARLGVPLAVSIQGDSDLRIVGVKRDLRRRYRGIWHGAAAVFPFAPWAGERMAALLGPRTGPVVTLPCPVAGDSLRAPQPAPGGGPRFLSAFHLGVAGRKNAVRLIEAAGIAAGALPGLELEIIGGGDPAAFSRLAKAARELAPGRVRFAGNLPNAEVTARMHAATAFVLPSLRESFGMVFAEALFAGAPCLVPRGWGIDGYFPDGAVTVAVEPGDPASIAAGLLRLGMEEAAFKRRLAELGAARGLDRFTRQAIARSYLEALPAAG